MKRYYVHTYKLSGGTTHSDAYEDYDGHTTITHNGGIRVGAVRARRLPPELDALPRGDERIERVHAWYDANKKESESVCALVSPVVGWQTVEIEGNES